MKNPNYPAVSDPQAMLLYPEARRLERDTLIDQANLRPGMRVLDIQAAGGYLSDRIYDKLHGDVQCLCLEPCAELADRIDPVHQVCRDPLVKMTHIESASIDVALGLAGFHHSSAVFDTIREIYRVLKPGGELVVCDVIKESKMAVWLNDYVDKNSPAGHRGTFFPPGAISQMLRDAGFQNTSETIKQVPWLFASESDLTRFCKGLFNLTPSLEVISRALPQYLDVLPGTTGVSLAWELTYAKGYKKAT